LIGFWGPGSDLASSTEREGEDMRERKRERERARERERERERERDRERGRERERDPAVDRAFKQNVNAVVRLRQPRNLHPLTEGFLKG
jgi:nitric oxide reductase activation protein